jgi:hypothetical protein
MTDYLLSIDLGTINYAYCIIETATEKIIDWNLLELGSSKDSHEMLAMKLAESLNSVQLHKLKVTPDKKKTMTVVIELQPKKNIKTLILSGMTIMYYSLEKLKNQHLEDPSYCEITKVIGYHAKNKLKYYEPMEGDEPLKVSHLSNGYYKNKVTSKQQCERILKQKGETQWLEFFHTGSKADDKSDSYLQGLAYGKFVLKLKKERPESYKDP